MLKTALRLETEMSKPNSCKHLYLPLYLPLLALALGLSLWSNPLANPVLAQETQSNSVLETEPAVPAQARLTLDRSTIQQGQAFEVSFEPAAGTPPDAFSVTVADQTIALFRNGQQYRCFVGLPGDQKAGGYTLRVHNSAGQELAATKIEVSPGSFYTQHIRYSHPQLSPEQQAVLDREDALVDKVRASRSSQPLWKHPFKAPVPHRVSAAYGTRRYLNGKYNGYHSGVDFASPMGYPVKAPAGGKVTLARYFSKWNSNGNLIFLDHGLGVTSVYLHLSKILVKEGETVQQDQTLGYIGTTGRSTGPHLHWGVYLNGQNTDGLAWIRYTQTLQPLSE